MVGFVALDVPHAVDEECRHTSDAALQTAFEIGLDAGRVGPPLDVIAKSPDVEPEIGGLLYDCVHLQHSLVLEQPPVHLPECGLSVRRFRGLGGELGQRMHLGERELPEGEPDRSSQALLNDAQDVLGGAAVEALVVAVLEECHRSVGWPGHVVGRANRNRQEFRFGFAPAQEAGARGCLRLARRDLRVAGV